ncbi:MAG: hypothetical protein K6B52_04185 [Clostridiales bacterium]|nr:hypothetical protein [Clostridiales bacterium]
MKKTFSVLLALLMAVSVCTVAFAAGPPKVTVTISDKGNLVVVNEIISVTDADKDGSLTINDALICAHDSFYDGGAAKGYEYTVTTGQYAGISMVKLWGDKNKGSLGYYVNDTMSWSLADPVKDGDFIYAFSYKDADNFSDSYAFFDMKEAKAETYSEIELKLSKIGFDENWDSVVVPAEGAMILINGKETGVVTDKDGKAKVTVTAFDDCVISAKSTAEGKIITPPACSVSVKLNIKNIITYYFNYIINFIKGLFAN